MDCVKVIKSFSSSKDKKMENRQIASSKAAQYVKEVAEKIKLPDLLKKEEEEDIER